MKLSDDKKSVTLSINKNLTTGEVERLILDLSVARAHMLPPVPFEPPSPCDPSDDPPHVSSQDDPYVSAGSLRDGRFRLWLRSFGFGWMVFTFPAEKACALRDYLIANTQTAPSGANFFSNKGGNGGQPH